MKGDAMAWATTAEALAYTGITVSNHNITAAQAVIELFSDVTEEDNSKLTPRSLRLLKQAVA
jgi:hypothetical protein